MSAEEIADFLEEDVLTIQRIYDIANTYAPEYDIEKISTKVGKHIGNENKSKKRVRGCREIDSSKAGRV